MRRAFAVAAAIAALSLLAAQPALAADVPPQPNLVARSSLPPGESGFYTAAGEAQYMVDNNPADFGPNADDQRTDYWQFKTKAAPFAAPTGTPATPMAGVRIYRDASGVPEIYGDNGYDVWYGAGYAAGTDRLFLADAIRRTAEGTLAELTGPKQVPKDLAERTVFYTKAELDGMLAELTPQGRDAIQGYTAGIEQRITEDRTNPTELPIEYTLLTSLPTDWTVEDTLAAGVYITRDVASQGAAEFDNIHALTELEATYGVAQGRKVFDDLYWNEDPKAAVSIPDTTFSNEAPADRSPAAREANFQKAAAYAEKLPISLATGLGTGDSPVPAVVSPAVPTALPSLPALPGVVQRDLSEISEGIERYTAGLHGGSFGLAISGNRTASGHAMLVSEPQLDYSYPGELYELEVHGGGYDSRGVSVPGIPTVGIGWTGNVGWALTTGYSKTIDSFIETTRANPTAGGPPQYLHNGTWNDESCRTESINYRIAEMGVPAGPANTSTQVNTVCRTDHGPVVATTPDGTMARSVDFAGWLHEDDTVDGILTWDRATSMDDIVAGVKLVVWNENIVAADSAGNIGYFHPGRYLRRAAGVDQRFPENGDGSQDPTGYLSYDEMPHVIDPPEGYVANWNTKPAHGWVDGDLSGSTTRPGGPSNRVVRIQQLLSARTNFTPDDLPVIDKAIGTFDFRSIGYLPLMTSITGTPGLTAGETAALTMLKTYDGRAYAPGEAGGSTAFDPGVKAATSVTDGPDATLFAAFVTALRQQVFGAALPADLYSQLTALPAEGHQYDVTKLDNLVERVLIPGYSGLTPAMDYTGGRTPAVVVRAALDDALAALAKAYGADPSTWHRPHAVSHLTSFTDTVGPTAVTEPFIDRGSWIHMVAFTAGAPYAVPNGTVTSGLGTTKPSGGTTPAGTITQPPVPGSLDLGTAAGSVPTAAPERGTLATTGLGLGLPALALLLLTAGATLRRRRTQ